MSTRYGVTKAGRDAMDSVRGFLDGFWGTWLLYVGQELGLLQALGDRPLRPEDLAEQLGFEPVYTEVWCRAAHAYRLLEEHPGGAFGLAEGWIEVLEPAGAWAETYVRLAVRVAQSLEAVFRGSALPEPKVSLDLLMAPGIRASYAQVWERQVAAVPELVERLRKGGRLIEFGCGCGYGLELFRRLYPAVELTGIECDYESAREAERATRAVIVVGTAEGSRYESRFDVAVFHGSLAHCEEPRLAMTRAAAALKPGGFLVVSQRDALPADPREQRTPAGRLGLGERFFYGMFLGSHRPASPPSDQLRAWAAEEGLAEVASFEGVAEVPATLIFRRV